MAAAIKMRAERREPSPERLAVDQPLAGEVSTIGRGGFERIMAGDEEPRDAPALVREELACAIQLISGHEPARGQAGAGRVETEDRGLRIKLAQPGIGEARGELSEVPLEATIPMGAHGVPIVIAGDDG